MSGFINKSGACLWFECFARGIVGARVQYQQACLGYRRSTPGNLLSPFNPQYSLSCSPVEREFAWRRPLAAATSLQPSRSWPRPREKEKERERERRERRPRRPVELSRAWNSKESTLRNVSISYVFQDHRHPGHRYNLQTRVLHFSCVHPKIFPSNSSVRQTRFVDDRKRWSTPTLITRRR